jgi:transcription initiation factor TFIIIB Brf1 subunit/transcription initiation factor TFIIB
METIQKEIKELTDEILEVTMVIRDKFPELYQHFGETPFLTSADNKGVDSNSLEEYLNTIRSQLKIYEDKK